MTHPQPGYRLQTLHLYNWGAFAGRHQASIDAANTAILGYDCNLACDYCTITPAMRRRVLTSAQVLAAMRQARRDGFDTVAFTGGEPTIRGDLLGLLSAARSLGFVDRKVQTNGLMLGQGDNAARLVAAGVSRVHVSVHTLVARRSAGDSGCRSLHVSGRNQGAFG